MTLKMNHPFSCIQGSGIRQGAAVKKLLPLLLCAGITSAESIYAASGDGQATQPKNGFIEEVIVTAQKHAYSAQLTPVALTAATGESLIKAGITTPADLNGISPSFYATMGNGQLQLTMRGVGNEILTSGIGEAGVAVHNNGVYLGSNVTSGLGFFDVERVEILRGPQGTLWGRNSTGGAINIIQKRPTDEFEAYLDIDYGNYNTASLMSAISGQLTDNAQGRLAMKYRGSDGYLKNLSPGGDDFGDDNSLSLRFSLNIDVSDDTRWLIAAGYSDWDINGRAFRQEGTAFPEGRLHPLAGTPAHLSFSEIAFGPTTPSGKFETYGTHPDLKDDMDSHYLTSELSMDFNSVSLNLTTDYREHDRANQTGDFTPTQIAQSGSLFDEQVEEFSQEIRLSSLTHDTLSWVAGLYYYQQELDSRVTIGVGPYPGIPDVLLGGAFGPEFPRASIDIGGTLDVKSFGVFGQSTYHFTEQWAATLGLRYSRDNKKTDEFNNFYFGNLDGLALSQTTAKFDEDWSDWTGKIGLEFNPAEDVFLFANVSKGYKSGGINLGVGSGPFDAETLLNYEIGVKSTLWDGRLRLNASAYYSDFEGYQLQSIEGFTTIITNGDAEISGLEVEVDVVPAETWLISLVATWTDSEITGFDKTQLLNPATLTPVPTGQALPRTPDFSYRLGLQKTIPVNQSSDLTASLTYTWQDDVNLDAFDTFGAKQENYGLVNANITWLSADGSWSLDVYGRNLTNEYYKTAGFFYAVSLGSTVQAQIGLPRTYGARVRYNF